MSVDAVRRLRLDADEAAGDMAAIEDPIHRVTGEDVGDLLLGGKDNQRRLQQPRADHRRSLRLRDRDRTRRARLERMRWAWMRECGIVPSGEAES